MTTQVQYDLVGVFYKCATHVLGKTWLAQSRQENDKLPPSIPKPVLCPQHSVHILYKSVYFAQRAFSLAHNPRGYDAHYLNRLKSARSSYGSPDNIFSGLRGFLSGVLGPL